MVSTVKSRPNHYELLGLAPEASRDEVVQAFAKELGLLRPRAFGTLAEVTIAYETLKDPVKRQAYDASIGLNPEPAIPSHHAPPEWAPFLVRASAKPAEQTATDPSPPPLPRPEPRFEPRVAPSATALLRPPIKATIPRAPPMPRIEPRATRQSEPVETLRPEPMAGDNESFDRLELEAEHEAGEESIRWKMPALAAGALALAVGVGAWTGFETGNESVTVKVPSARPPAAISESAPVPAPGVAEIPSEERAPVKPPAQVAPARPPLQIDLPDEQEAEATPSEQSRPVEIAAEPVVESTASAAKLPLPNAVIASTLRRIGYPCSEVASTTAVGDGAPGVFTVTCTSGHSYRAAPVHGRYRFRRLSSR